MPRAALAVFAAAAVWCTGLTASAQRSYVVRSGDTLARIARRFHVSVETLQRANRLRGTNVRQGATLTIPATARWARDHGRSYTVREGDTLTRIARRYHVTVDAIRTANRMRGHALRPGDSLRIPGPGTSGALITEGNPVTEENPEVAEEIQARAGARATDLGLGPTFVGQRLLREGPAPEWVTAAGTVDGLEGTILLPVEDGRYLRGWGSGEGGYHLAVDIGAPEGTTVRAGERGLVAYAGHGIRGYGNIIMIVHPNGWVTAYAHNRVNLVIPGQLVTRGQPIAEVGQTGFARGPHCHFFLVDGLEHCDPTPLFTPRITRPNGEEPDGPEVAWDGDHRPSGVQCLTRRQRPHPAYERQRQQRRRRPRR
ncbi:MAG: LysM peptidoglycan-binding domain-containing protein [Sandaracinaceae bacterium]|nr:LysM peptidoglycan-binding domain-containing protein [Sandaracinaceae bacterium]